MGIVLVTMLTVFAIYWVICYVGEEQDITDRLDYYFNLDDDEDSDES